MRFTLVLLLFPMLAACTETSESWKAISLKRALEPDEECAFTVESESWDTGWYDPTEASSMNVHLDVGASGLEPADVVQLKKVRVCYTDELRVENTLGNHVECDAIFSASARPTGVIGETVTISGTIAGCEGEGCNPSAQIQLEFLGEPMLKQIYGNAFAPSDISVWFTDAPMGEAACCRYFYTDLFLLAEEDRVCCTDSLWEMGVATGPDTGGPWDAFSPRPAADLKIEFQLVGENAQGETMTSAWLTLPTTICPGCIRAHGEATGCETMVGSFCDYGVCDVEGESVVCTDEGCPESETPCTGYTYGLTGETPDVQGCVPAQLQGITERCRSVVACE